MTELGLAFEAGSAAMMCGVIAVQAAIAAARPMNSRRVDFLRREGLVRMIVSTETELYFGKVNPADSSSSSFSSSALGAHGCNQKIRCGLFFFDYPALNLSVGFVQKPMSTEQEFPEASK